MLFHEIDGLTECIGAHHGIGIEEQHIGAVAQPYADVVGFCETYISPTLHHLHLREMGLEVLDGAVGRLVIDDDDFSVNTFHRLFYATDTGAEILACIIAYDDDREFFHSVSLLLVSASQRFCEG